MTPLLSTSSSAEATYLFSGGGNCEPCLLEDVCGFENVPKLRHSGRLTTRILFTGPVKCRTK